MKIKISLDLPGCLIYLLRLLIITLIGAAALYLGIYVAAWVTVHPNSWVSYLILFLVVGLLFLFKLFGGGTLDILSQRIFDQPRKDSLKTKELFEDQHISYHQAKSVADKDKHYR